MILTEEVARTKICHKTLAPVPQTDGVTVWVANSPQLCIGSDCMAWVWGGRTNGIDRGYCGLVHKRA